MKLPNKNRALGPAISLRYGLVWEFLVFLKDLFE